MKILVDSYAWIEYLDGSLKGKKVEQALENAEVYTIALTLAEVVSRAKRLHKDFNIAFETISTLSKIIPIDAHISQEAGVFHASIRERIKDFGLVDSFIFVIAKKIDAKILTGDPHFKGFKEAVLI